MLKSLKFYFVISLTLLSIAIGTLMYFQYNFSSQIHKLFNSHLALKEIHLQYMQMEQSKTHYFLQQDSLSIDNVEAYADTLDIYLSIIAEDIKEFHYPEFLESEIASYVATFMELTKETNTHNEVLKKRLSKHSLEIKTFIEQEQLRLIPIVVEKMEKIEYTQQLISIIMFLIILLMLYIILKPILHSIKIFQDFFLSSDSVEERLDIKGLYYSEVIEVAHSVNRMLENQEKAQKVKDDFLSNMSHELRTPLNAIGGFAGILLRKLPQEKETILPIVQSSQDLLQLVSDILDLSKIKSGKFSIVDETFNVHEELLLFTKRFTHLLRDKDISFHIEQAYEKNLALLGDWFRISQILNNFMSNAIKFTPKNGKIQLHIKYEQGIFHASVTDSGIGIEEASLETILKPFVQSSKGVSKKYGGTGLGLSIAKTLTNMMDGTFDVQSTINIGSTFSVKIPLEQKQASQETIEIVEVQKQIIIKAHILIAEDNKTNALLLSMLLDDLNITYDIANDGQEAFDIFEEDKYSIILMDENMPNLSGTDSMLLIRKTYGNVPPIIAVTANAMKGDKEALIAKGMDDFLSKPIDNQLLINILQKHL